VVIDAERSIDAIAENIWRVVSTRLLHRAA
jgi:hypothetical protein